MAVTANKPKAVSLSIRHSKIARDDLNLSVVRCQVGRLAAFLEINGFNTYADLLPRLNSGTHFAFLY